MQPRLWPTIREWWSERRVRESFRRTTVQFLANLWNFLGDSTPSRRRQRYGDVDYDWDHRVDTTAATVSWRDRLIGQFLSPYQATDPALFHEMLSALQIDFSGFTFIDIGSGKGRTLLLATDYPFERIIGVELLPALHAVAESNIRAYKGESQKCFEIESICTDARHFPLPPTPLVLYLFNPLPEAGLRQFIRNLEGSLTANPREAFVLYHNPLLEHLLAAPPFLKRVSGTHQYTIYSAKLP